MTHKFCTIVILIDITDSEMKRTQIWESPVVLDGIITCLWDSVFGLIFICCVTFLQLILLHILLFFFFFSPPVVLRDMSRGRDLEQILSQYTTFVKPAFEEFCLPVSVVVSPDYALICSASYSVKQTHITFVSKDILFFPD